MSVAKLQNLVQERVDEVVFFHTLGSVVVKDRSRPIFDLEFLKC